MLVEDDGLNLLLVAKIDVIGLLAHSMSMGQVALVKPDMALISCLSLAVPSFPKRIEVG